MYQDHDSFINHYQNSKNKLFNFLMYRLNFDRELAEDILMDVVLKAYENYKRFNREKGSFETWIFTIAHNHLINYWRNNKKRKFVPLNHAISHQDTPAINEKLDKKFETERIKHILSLMKPGEREIITLKYINEFSTEEIAKILKKNANAVRTHLSRSIKQFKYLYGKFISNNESI